MIRNIVRLIAVTLAVTPVSAVPVSAGVVFEVETTYVVINHEKQYSVFPADRPAPKGWKVVSKGCRPEACLKHIEEVWTDMRPLAIRQTVEEQLKLHLQEK